MNTDTVPAPVETVDPAALEARKDLGYKLLCEHLQKRGADAQRRIMAHLRAVVGRSTPLPNYHSDATVSVADKAKLYTECVKALAMKDYTALKGQVADGDKRAEPVIEPDEVIPLKKKRATQPTTTESPEEVVIDNTEEVNPSPSRRFSDIPSDGEDPSVMLTTALRRLMHGSIQPAEPKPAELDVIQVREIAMDAIKHAMSNGEFPEHRVKALIDSAIEAVSIQRVFITAPTGTTIETGRQHYKFPLLLACLSQRLNVALVGPAGSTKTSTARAAAKALGLQFAATSFGPMTSKSDLFGYKDAAGNYHETDLVRLAHSGGVYLGDEFDAGNAGVATYTNMLTSCQPGEEFSTPIGMKAKHADFCFLAGLNTYGMGANRVYVGRNQQNGATMDRFVVIDWDYDDGLEASFVGVSKRSPKFDLDAGGIMSTEDWLTYVRKVRDVCAKQGVRHIVSPRATIHGVKLFSAGIGRTHVEEMVIWKGLEQAQVTKIKAAL